MPADQRYSITNAFSNTVQKMLYRRISKTINNYTCLYVHVVVEQKGKPKVKHKHPCSC